MHSHEHLLAVIYYRLPVWLFVCRLAMVQALGLCNPYCQAISVAVSVSLYLCSMACA